MTADQALPPLTEIVRAAIGRPDVAVARETTAKDVAGWDSLKQVIIILEVEERFGITLSAREIDGIGCVGDFLDLIAAKA